MMVCGVPVVNYSFDHVVSIIDSLGTAKVRGPEIAGNGRHQNSPQ